MKTSEVLRKMYEVLDTKGWTRVNLTNLRLKDDDDPTPFKAAGAFCLIGAWYAVAHPDMPIAAVYSYRDYAASQECNLLGEEIVKLAGYDTSMHCTEKSWHYNDSHTKEQVLGLLFEATRVAETQEAAAL